MKNLVCIYFTVLVSVCFSQTTENNLFIKELKLQSIQAPDSSELKVELARAYSKSGQVDSAFKYLFIGAKYDSTAFIVDNQDFYNLTLDKRWNLFLESQLNKIEIYNKFKYKDRMVTKALWTIGIRDQAFYSIINENEKMYGLGCKVNDSIWKIKYEINKINLIVVENIIKQYGWPKFSEFGTLACRNAFFVIQHSMVGSQKRYLPMIKEACINGDAEWSDYALMKDRVLKMENKPQIYGSQIDQNLLTHNYELYPIEDETHVNKRRDSVGLGPIEDYVKQFGISYVKPSLSKNSWDYRHYCILSILMLCLFGVAFIVKLD